MVHLILVDFDSVEAIQIHSGSTRSQEWMRKAILNLSTVNHFNWESQEVMLEVSHSILNYNHFPYIVHIYW